MKNLNVPTARALALLSIALIGAAYCGYVSAIRSIPVPDRRQSSGTSFFYGGHTLVSTPRFSIVLEGRYRFDNQAYGRGRREKAFLRDEAQNVLVVETTPSGSGQSNPFQLQAMSAAMENGGLTIYIGTVGTELKKVAFIERKGLEHQLVIHSESGQKAFAKLRDVACF